jgi:hypothetical protein
MATKRTIGKPFAKGFDARRHELTTEERRRGGITRWKMTMNQWRAGNGWQEPWSLTKRKGIDDEGQAF